MCSIAGLFWETPHSPEETLAILRAMNRALARRGPDGEGAAIAHAGGMTVHRWTGSGQVAEPARTSKLESSFSFGLGMNRLAIRDVEAGHQPMLDASRRVTIVFNGEIYNTEELERELTQAGARFRTTSDTEIILEAYLRWGRACVERLVGMFAFAIWDDRDASLFIARDRLGIKPLVYARTKDALVFGSEIKALLASGLVARRVREESIARFMLHLYVPAPDGPIVDVSTLEPGHTLTLKNGRLQIDRYWSLSFAPGEPASLEQHIEKFGSLFRESVRSHMLSDVPIGAFLSGGVDSTAVVASMKKLRSDVNTYTVGFDVRAYDESDEAKASAEYLGTNHHETRVTIADVEREVIPALTHYDQPFADASAVPTYVLCRETARHVKVALAGDGSDEQLAGYARARQYAVLEGLRHLPAPMRALLWTSNKLSPWLSHARRAQNLADYARVMAGSGGRDPMSGYVHLRNQFRNGWLERLLTADYRQKVASDDPAFHIHRVYAGSRAPDLLTKMLEVEVHTYLPNDILQKVDIASGAHGLEVRVPFLDHRLVEAIASMPLHAKLRPGETKVVLRRALGPALPPHTLQKKRKQGFHFPVSEWLRGKGAPLLHDILLSARAKARGYFVPSQLDVLVREHLESRADHGNKIWALLQLELWHQTWIDRAQS